MDTACDLCDGEGNKRYPVCRCFNKKLVHVPLSSSASTVDDGDTYLQGDLIIPSPTFNLKAIIIFALGDENSNGRANPRNQCVTRILNNNGFATLLIDLLTPKEQESDIKTQKKIGTYSRVVLNNLNIHLLSDKLSTITSWAIENVSEIKDIPIGYFGANTGAAAAIEVSTAVYNPYANKIYAIVIMDGRPDLAYHNALGSVKAATLLIVGAKDSNETIAINQKALKQLKNAKSNDLVIVPNAVQLYGDWGQIEQSAHIATKWYANNLGKALDKKNGGFVPG